jgi:ribosomal protein S5
VLNVATPPDRLPVPKTVAPSLNVTIPVAVDGNTIAVKVTVAPKADGLGLDVTTVAVEAFDTVWVIAGEVEGPKFALPP